MANKFHFPVSNYYNKAGKLYNFVTEFTEDVETNVFDKFENNSDSLDSSDLSYIEGASGYTQSKSSLNSLINTYQKKLSEMSSEGASNPMNGVVEKDQDYSTRFSNIETGNIADELSAASTKFNTRITMEVSEDILDADTLKRLSLIGANVKDIKDLLEMLNDTTDQAKLGELIDIIKGNDKLMAFLTTSDDFIEALKANQYLGPIISKSTKFVKFFEKAGEKLGLVTSAMKGDGTSFLSKILSNIDDLDNFKGALAKFGVAATVLNIGLKGFSNFAANQKDFRDGKCVRGTLKTVAGTAIDMAADFNMIDGAVWGAKIGSMIPIPGIGSGIGAGVGFALGLLNQGAQLIWPNMYDDLKNVVNGGIDKLCDGAQKLVDDVGKEIGKAGKAVKDGWNNFTSGLSSWGKNLGFG